MGIVMYYDVMKKGEVNNMKKNFRILLKIKYLYNFESYFKPPIIYNRKLKKKSVNILRGFFHPKKIPTNINEENA